MIGTELNWGTAGLAILPVLEKEPLHGYEIARSTI
jgi:DNA-binding PadR family transcriptional regulator